MYCLNCISQILPPLLLKYQEGRLRPLQKTKRNRLKTSKFNVTSGMARIIKMYMCTGPEVIHLLTNAYPAEYSTYLTHKPTLLAITSHINTRKHANFYQPSVNVAKYQKGVYYLGVKLFNALPSYIKAEFNNPKKF
jgi:hypothetical protein